MSAWNPQDPRVLQTDLLGCGRHNTCLQRNQDDHSEYLDLPKTVSGALIGAQGWARTR